MFPLNLNLTADESLNQCADSGQKQRAGKCLQVMLFRPDSLVDVQREMFGDQTNGHVHEVVRRHKGTGDLREEREKYDVGDTDQEDQTENVPYHLFQEEHGKEFRFQSVLKGGSFKFDPNLLLGLLLNLRLVINILCVHLCPP